MPIITPINENECIGDSLELINSNFDSLDTKLSTLITTLTTFAQAPGATVYTNLSTQLRSLATILN